MQQLHLPLHSVPQGESSASQTEQGDTNLFVVDWVSQEVVGGQNHIGYRHHDT